MNKIRAPESLFQLVCSTSPRAVFSYRFWMLKRLLDTVLELQSLLTLFFSRSSVDKLPDQIVKLFKDVLNLPCNSHLVFGSSIKFDLEL